MLGLIANKITKNESKKTPFIGAFSAMIPDLIDKPIGSIFFGTGRWIGHSLLFINLFGLTLVLTKDFWISKMERYFGDIPSFTPYLIWIGMYLHLLGDMPTISPIVIFWPLLGDFPIGHTNDFLKGIQNPITEITEAAGFIFYVYWGWKEQWKRQHWLYFSIFILGYMSLFLLLWILLVGF